MFASFSKHFLSYFTSKSANPEVPVETSQPADDCDFVEVKPGRILRVRHIIPDRAVVEKPSSQGGIVSCKRKITSYRSGQLFFEKLDDRARVTRKPCQNEDTTSSSSAAETAGAEEAPAVREVDRSQDTRKGKRKRTVVVDCERQISACKESHADVALFFIHGVGGSLDVWSNQLDFFSRLGYEVIAPDLIGHGESSAPQIDAAYTFYALADDLKIIFKRYARKRNIVIGHSYGVSLCTFLAHEFPQQIHKMVLVNGGGPTSLEPHSCSIFNLPTCVLRCLSPVLTWAFLKKGFVRQGPREKQLLKESNGFNVSPFVLRAIMNGQYWPEGDELYHAEITVPTMVVHGMQDKLVPTEQDQDMAEVLSIASLKCVEDGSHMVMLERPEVINTLLHEYFLWEPASLPPPNKC